MAAVLGTMTLAQALQTAAAAAGLIDAVVKVANDLHAKGGSGDAPLMPEHVGAVTAAVGGVLKASRWTPAGVGTDSAPSAENFGSGGRSP